MSTNLPLVSIIMPAWNRATLIGETIRSVLVQTYSNWELIVMDDGSTDQTQTIINEFQDSRIRYYHLEHTGQITSLRVKGVAHALGDYIAFLDSDDLWTEKKLSIQVNLLLQKPDLDFIISNGYHFGDFAAHPVNQELLSGNLFLPLLMGERFIYFVPSLLARKKALLNIGAASSDLEHFLRLAFDHKGAFVNDRLIRVRKHPRSDSHLNPIKGYQNYLEMLDNFQSEGKLAPAQHRNLKARELYKMGLFQMRQQLWKDAWDTLESIKAVYPIHLKAFLRQNQIKWCAFIQGVRIAG